MAASSIVSDIIGDVTECPICTEVIANSKVLPCIHTFCLKCLEQYCGEKKPGDKVPCPPCRRPFIVPKNGLSALPTNFFVEKLLDAQKLATMNQVKPSCEICSCLKNSPDEIPPPAVSYCIDCESNMCEQCVRIHLAMKSSKHHQVTLLGELSMAGALLKLSVEQCDIHTDKKIEMYCTDCEIPVCTTCFITNHNGHKCSDIIAAAEDLKTRITKDMNEANDLLLLVNKQSVRLERISNDFACDTQTIENLIRERGNEIKQLVDKHVQTLINVLNDRKSNKLKELETAKKELLDKKINLESFINSSQSVVEKAIPSDIVRLATGLKTIADDVIKMKIVPIGKQIKVSFVPSDLKMFTDESNTTNIIGETSIRGNVFNSSFLDSSSVVDAEHTISTRPMPIGITISGEELFVLLRSPPEIQVFDYETFTHTRNISVTKLTDLWDMTSSSNTLFVSATSGCINGIPLDTSEPSISWSTGGGPVALSSLSSGNILATCPATRRLIEYTITGQSVREILLQDTKTDTVKHAIQLNNDQFLVSYSHDVCLIDGKGQMVKSYNGSDKTERKQLRCAFHLAADMNGFCFVLDYDSVVMVNNEAEFVKELVPDSVGLIHSMRMFLDRNQKRLFVAVYGGARVAVFDLLP